MSIDWKELKRIQDAKAELGFGLEHLPVCICTQGPEGVILDYDCGRSIARREA